MEPDSTSDYVVNEYTKAFQRGLDELNAQNNLNEKNGHPELNQYVFSVGKYLDPKFIEVFDLNLAIEVEGSYLLDYKDKINALLNKAFTDKKPLMKVYFAINSTLGLFDLDKDVQGPNTIDELKKVSVNNKYGKPAIDAIGTKLQSLKQIGTTFPDNRFHLIFLGLAIEYDIKGSVGGSNDLNKFVRKKIWKNTGFISQLGPDHSNKIVSALPSGPSFNITTDQVSNLPIIYNKVEEYLDILSKDEKNLLPTTPVKGTGKTFFDFIGVNSTADGGHYDKGGASVDKKLLTEVSQQVHKIFAENSEMYETYIKAQTDALVAEKGVITDQDLKNLKQNLEDFENYQEDAFEKTSPENFDNIYKLLLSIYECAGGALDQISREAIIPQCAYKDFIVFPGTEYSPVDIPFMAGTVDAAWTTVVDLLELGAGLLKI
ncbi:MAG: hypothetical protein ACRCVT_16630, partial [Leadbetterella sp.]